MALPKRKVSKSRKKKRKGQQYLKPITYTICPNCQEAVLPHRVCMNCGYYKGRQVIPIEEK